MDWHGILTTTLGWEERVLVLSRVMAELWLGLKAGKNQRRAVRAIRGEANTCYKAEEAKKTSQYQLTNTMPSNSLPTRANGWKPQIPSLQKK